MSSEGRSHERHPHPRRETALPFAPQTVGANELMAWSARGALNTRLSRRLRQLENAAGHDLPQATPCPLCGAAEHRQLYRFEHSRWIPGSVVRCEMCRVIYKIPSDSSTTLTDVYDRDYAELDYWAQDEAALRSLSKIRACVADTVTTGSLLDVGCGPGLFMELAQQAGFRVTGLEYNPTLAARARERTRAEVVEGDFLSSDLGDRRFDVVTLLDVIEHLADPIAALKRCRELLNPGGALVLYTPNHASLIVQLAVMLDRVTRGRCSGPVREIFDCTHVVYFDQQSLMQALAKAGMHARRTVLLKYDPSRSQQATGISAWALKAIESVSPLVDGQFRILLFATRAEVAGGAMTP
jgi:2-polyprenyl-3-methyl-5-hydroxy-6-metoxy-1,4-benzoquinol methylase